jgi:heme-degrading monooxygenase HmoA
MEFLARTPPPPYYAVIFTSQRTATGDEAYAAMAERMVELAAEQTGYLGVESARDERGQGITVSYWQTLEAIGNWGKQAEHRIAQRMGKSDWYEAFRLRTCRVEHEDSFERTLGIGGQR